MLKKAEKFKPGNPLLPTFRIIGRKTSQTGKVLTRNKIKLRINSLRRPPYKPDVSKNTQQPPAILVKDKIQDKKVRME